MLAALAASNAAQHTELDWQAHNEVGPRGREFSSCDPYPVFTAIVKWLPCLCLQALSQARRLVAHHASVVTERLQGFVALVAPAVDALCSQVARNAMRVLQACPKLPSSSSCTAPFG